MAIQRVSPQDVIDRFRRDVDDQVLAEGEVDGLLWSQADVLQYLNQAQYALAEKIGYLRGEIEVAVVADYPEVTLPSGVIDVFSVYLVSANKNLRISDRNELDETITFDYGVPRAGASWRDRTGVPAEVYLDVELDKLFLIPTPTADDTLKILCTKLPDEVTADNLSGCKLAFRRPDYCWDLVPYMKYLAYGVQDADTYDPQRSEKFKLQADRCFERIYDSVQRLRRSNRPNSGTTGYGGIRF